MLKVWFSFLISLVIAVVFSACDKGCDVYVTGVAKIDNLTQREVVVGVCIGQRTKKVVTFAGVQNGSINIESHTETRIKTGGPSNACDPVQRKVSVYLTSENFNEVKFCHSPDTTSEVTVVEFNQDCPTGLIAQTAPVDTCK